MVSSAPKLCYISGSLLAESAGNNKWLASNDGGPVFISLFSLATKFH